MGEAFTLVVLLILSGVFSGSETALVAISMARVDALVKDGRPGARALAQLKQDPSRMLTTILIGNNVVNIATKMGMPACTLIQLSPPVRSWNLPNMKKVSSNRLFNIHSHIDLVVKIDGGAQGYSGTAVAGVERTKIIAFAGHSDSHDKTKWKNKKVPNLVKTVCP